ncbi:FHA domain-containing protein [Arthrobacter sp. C152]
MTGASYIPGTWLGVVRSRTAVLLGPGAPAELAGAVWDLLAGRPAVHEVLAAVTSSSGGSLAQIPPFGILEFDGQLRVFLRGDLELTVDSPDGPVELDGRDVTTWNERRFPAPAACRVAMSGAGAPGQPELPLGEGVVLLQALALADHAGPAAVGAGTAAASAPTASPAPAAPPAPAAGWAFSVQDAGEDSDGGASSAAATAEDAGPPGAAVDEPEQDLPGITLLPEHGVSAETVVGVLDDDADFAEPHFAEADPGEGVTAGASETEAEPGADPAGTPTADPGTAGAHQEPGGYIGGTSAPVNEQTTSYDHLWDRTVMRNIEDAAVREDPDAGADSGAGQPVALPAGGPLPALEQADGGQPGAEQGAAEQVDGEASGEQPHDGAAPGPVVEAGIPSGPGPETGQPSPRPGAGALIDSVPWRTGGNAGPAPASSSAPSPQPSPAAQATPPVPATPPAPGPGSNALDFDPDHDGQTVMKGSLPGMRGQQQTPTAPAPDGAANGPLVLARVCAQGHPNPPTAASCACGGVLLPDAVQVPRPRLGRMRLSTGELLDLDQSMVIGRQPSVSRVQGGVMPRLVQVPSPGGDISRSHVEVRLEGWHVMLCDLKATNGTVLVREGQPPRRLAQNEMAILLDGDIAELGENISLRFEEIP